MFNARLQNSFGPPPGCSNLLGSETLLCQGKRMTENRDRAKTLLESGALLTCYVGVTEKQTED